MFDHPYEGKVSGELLVNLRQGNRSVVDYSLEFRTLAASSGWNEAALLVIFRQGLHAGLRPCIDYRALNQISKSYPYPLPLVPVSLEQLQGARHHTKLDLRSKIGRAHV